MLGLQDAVLSDRRRRRPHAWTCGAAVDLADGSRWFLPRIDLRLVCTTGFLQDELQLATELARAAHGAGRFGPHLVECPVHLANVGRRLLQINYDLSREESQRLLRFADLGAMVHFTRAVGAALRDAAAAWGPHLDRDLRELGASRN